MIFKGIFLASFLLGVLLIWIWACFVLSLLQIANLLASQMAMLLSNLQFLFGSLFNICLCAVHFLMNSFQDIQLYILLWKWFETVSICCPGCPTLLSSIIHLLNNYKNVLPCLAQVSHIYIVRYVYFLLTETHEIDFIILTLEIKK